MGVPLLRPSTPRDTDLPMIEVSLASRYTNAPRGCIPNTLALYSGCIPRVVYSVINGITYYLLVLSTHNIAVDVLIINYYYNL